jgi:cell division protein FtsI/penicillin-binding protein 2
LTTSRRRSTAWPRLIEVLPKDRKRFRRLLEESRNFESLPIRTRLSEEEVARFAANRYLFPGVEVKARLFRQYPPRARSRRMPSATSTGSTSATSR